MKIVINKCYGGFSLSPKAVQLLSKKQGKECYFFESKYNHKTGAREYVRLTNEFPTGLFWIAFSTEKPTEKNYNECRLDARPKDRADQLLVQVVEELGEEADGSCAELKVIDIPDDVEYTIEEYDGQEWVSEHHRTWQ